MSEKVRYEVQLDGVDKFEHGMTSMKHHANVLHETMGELKKTLVQFFAIEKIIDFGKESLKAFTDANEASAQLNATLQSTNNAVGMTRAELDELSESLSKNSLNTKTAEVSMQSILTTFTSLHEDVFPQASQAINDMAAKMHSGLNETAVQVGKALQDPIHGITALHRVGVNFSEAQKNVIKSLVETGQVAKAQQLIIKELNTEFGGSAKAAAESNPIQFMKNQAEEMLVKVGEGISKLFVAIRPILDKVLEAVGDIIGIFESSGIGDMLKTVLGIVGQIVKEFMKIVSDILPHILQLVGPLVHLFQMIVSLVMEIIQPLEEDLAPIIDLIVEIVTDIVSAFQSLMPVLKPIFHLFGEIMHVLIKIQLFIDRTIIRFIEWLTHTKIFKAVWDSIVTVIEKAVGFVEKIVHGIKYLLGISDEPKKFGTAKSAAEKMEEAKLGNEKGVFGGNADKTHPELVPTSKAASVTGTKQVIINVSINKLVETIKIMAQDIKSGANQTQSHVADALLSAVNQFSASVDI